MNTKLITTSFLLATMSLTACTKSYVTYQTLDGKTTSESMKGNTETSNSIDSFIKLVTADEKNIALAEVLAAPIANENKELVKNLIKELSPDEISSILSQTQNETETLKQLFLFRGNMSLGGNDIFKQSIFNDFLDTNKNKLDLAQVQLTSATFNYLKNKSLNEILTSYNNILDISSKEVAKKIIVDIAEQNPSLAQELESDARNAASLEEFLVKIRQTKNLVDRIDQAFYADNLNFKEEILTVGSVAIGALIYNQIKGNETFISLANKFQEVKNKIEEITNHAKKVQLAVRTIKESTAKMQASQKDFTDGLAGIKDNIKQGVDNAKIAYKTSSRVDGDRIVNFLYEKVVKNDIKDESRKPRTSISLIEVNLEKNLQKTFTASAIMADNLSNILTLTNTISRELNLEIPKDLQKAIATAEQVAAGVKLASSLVQGFMSGGVLSAVTVLNSGSVSSLLGTQGTDPMVTAALGRIEGKISQVLETQKKMLEIQVETAKMIKNLAIMIDDYHQQEMMALASLRDYQLVNLEISKSELNSDIRQCENLINFKLQKGSSIANLDLDKFYSNFKTHNDLKSLVKSSGKENFNRCQNAIVDAFGSTLINESKLLSIFNSSEEDNLYAFQRDIYLPLNQLLHYFVSDVGLNKQILHLPIKNISNLDSKLYQLTSNFNYENSNNLFLYNMDNLISTKSLERYLSSYLILYPLLELDKNDWNLPLSELINSYYKNISSSDISPEDTGATSRGYVFMNNALNLIHSAIAQEALLAGESVIPFIRESMGKELLYNHYCNEDAASMTSKLVGLDDNISNIICSIRSNKLLMKNYLKYTINKNLGTQFTISNYQVALAQDADAKRIFPFLTGEIANSQLSLARIDGTWAVNLKLVKSGSDKVDHINIKLPTAEEVVENQVTYSENMEHLQKIQENVINALIKLSPAQYRPMKEREGLAKILLINKI